jgi:DNA ligase (NAD+)
MINKNLLDELNRLGFGADVDALESYVASLQDAAGMGEPKVTDVMYDYYVRLLRQLKPDSYVLKRNWEVDDYELDENDILLTKYGMKSITTIQNMADLYKFKEALGDRTVNMLASIKLNGHAIRAVYRNGKLVSGSTRGRRKKGRDITRHLKAVLPNEVEAWHDINIVEVRGEMLVPLAKFEYLRDYLKTPLSAVTSLLRDSVTDAELKYLDCVCYKALTENNELGLNKLSEEMDHLDKCGFKTPRRILVENVDIYNLNVVVEEVLNHFERIYDELEYATDGVVMAIDDNETFYSLGMDGNAYLGNFALKMGKYWESNIYKSIIKEIKWIPGKTYITPKAIIEPVITVTGATVENVPLYNVGVIERLKLIPGNEIYFKFGGETGVTLVAPDGTPISMLE